MVLSLGKAKVEDISLLNQLKIARPSTEVRALHKAALEGVAALEDGTCTGQALQAKVWAVSTLLAKHSAWPYRMEQTEGCSCTSLK